MWPRYRSVMWLCGWGPLILNHHPARFGVHGPNRTGNNSVCCISSNSNSNCNAEVPIPPRFTNGHIYQTKKEKKSIPIVMKTCFSEEKLIKQFGKPLSKRAPPPPTLLFLSNFSWPASLSKYLKTRNSTLILGGRKLCPQNGQTHSSNSSAVAEIIQQFCNCLVPIWLRN